MKIKIIEFFSVETDLARLSLVYISILSGICYGLLIFIINNAANLVFQDIALEIPLAAVYATLCVVFYFCQHYSISPV
ncbi:ATP-binding cassette transporter, partial [Candidatus Magnetomorum sp. HK-1]